ncbi:MAG TPA: heterodisulfide reductase-related iron-sulfur binding cluster [Candidatus Limnocylindria bacterium]|jgi:glycolate oxidase iron-sulfur subunit|nr:heterodisulfide reductase-related iron-sulfur binding cluster [Candidatus Limnocylindria bacterium]
MHVRSEDLATCISCGLCLNDCPTYRVLGEEADSPRGRIQLIRELVSSPAAPTATLTGHLGACLVCRACETVCPSGVPFGRIMEGAREVLAERRTEGRVERAMRRIGLNVIARRRRLAIATKLTDLAVRSGITSLVRRVGPRRLAWLSALAQRAEGPAFALTERADADVCLFAGCVMREAFGDTERATVRVLERDGHRVTAPVEQVCCGALHAHAGDGEHARELARFNIDAFAGTDLPIVANAAGCGAHLKAYGEVLRDDPAWTERGRAFARRVRDATEVARPWPDRVARPLRVVYQDACHLAHGQRIRGQPRALLRAIEGVTLIEIADAERCCGSAGTYNLTQPDISRELQRQKVAAILAARPDVVVSANPGCILQIVAGLRMAGSDLPVVHLMRVLDDPAVFA